MDVIATPIIMDTTAGGMTAATIALAAAPRALLRVHLPARTNVVAPYLPGVQCHACKRIGHKAANCDMLAVALFMDCYTKANLLDTERSKIEQDWLARWKEELGRPGWMPRQVMWTYCEMHNISPDDLDNAMNWDCWLEEADDLDLE
jgi:hypothetical protein